MTAGRAQAGVVPMENVINGTVRETYDLLLEHDLVIRGEESSCPVSLALAALPGQRIEVIERVYSAHPGARPEAGGLPAFATVAWLLTTCEHGRRWKVIADRGERGAAAVLVAARCRAVRLEVLADGIGDLPDNRTRFVVIAQPDAPSIVTRAGGRRTSDHPGRGRPQRAGHAPGRPPGHRRAPA